jgi:hypothetical protein
MKPIEFLGTTFFQLMQMQPKQTFYTTSLWLAEAILEFDKKDKTSRGESVEVNDRHLKRLAFVTRYTHEELKMPIAVAEAVVASTPMEQWNKPYGGRNTEGDCVRVGNKEASVLDIYRLLKESYRSAIMAVVDTIKEYSSEYRVAQNSDANVPSWIDDAPPPIQ